MKVTPGKPHIRFVDGAFALYRSRWKSKWPTAACVRGTTVTLLQQHLARDHQRNRFGFGFATPEQHASLAALVYHSQTPWR